MSIRAASSLVVNIHHPAELARVATVLWISVAKTEPTMQISVSELDAMITEGEDLLAEFEGKVVRQADPDMDMEHAMKVLNVMCQKLNELYAQRQKLATEYPSLARH